MDTYLLTQTLSILYFYSFYYPKICNLIFFKCIYLLIFTHKWRQRQKMQNAVERWKSVWIYHKNNNRKHEGTPTKTFKFRCQITIVSLIVSMWRGKSHFELERSQCMATLSLTLNSCCSWSTVEYHSTFISLTHS